MGCYLFNFKGKLFSVIWAPFLRIQAKYLRKKFYYRRMGFPHLFISGNFRQSKTDEPRKKLNK